MTTIERRPNKVALALVSVAVAALGLAWIVTRSSGESEAVPSTVAAATSSTSSRVVPLASLPATVKLRVAALEMGLPSDSHVILFAHTFDPNAVVRIEVDQGRVVTTPVDSVTSTAPAFLAVGPSVAVVRPYDHVSGYVVADTGSVTAPSGLLDEGTFMTCSDGSRDRVWLARETLLQVDFTGMLRAQISSREQRPMALGCDGAGEMLYRIGSATFVTGDGPPSLVTSNTVVAAGPRTFVVRDCGAEAACALTVVDRPTGERRSLTVGFEVATSPTQPVQPEGRIGSISPDGHTAVLFRAEREAIFVDLASGTGQGISSIAGDFQSFVWSTDSRYLFYIGSGNKLNVFDRDTRSLKVLGVNNVLALAGRAG